MIKLKQPIVKVHQLNEGDVALIKYFEKVHIVYVF